MACRLERAVAQQPPAVNGQDKRFAPLTAAACRAFGADKAGRHRLCLPAKINFCINPAVYGAVRKKAQPLFVDCALVGWNCSMNFFTKSLLLEMPQENLIRCLQGFVILPVNGAKPLHCGNEYIVIAALPLELL